MSLGIALIREEGGCVRWLVVHRAACAVSRLTDKIVVCDCGAELVEYGRTLTPAEIFTTYERFEAMSEQLPKWKCHKEVEAAMIAAIDGHIMWVETVPSPSITGGPRIKIHASTEYLEKHKPQVGGYYVRYRDGYESFSPSEAFEAGYTRI